MAHQPKDNPADGLKVTLSAIGNGLTVDKHGRPLLAEPFVFQCPPLEQFSVTHAMNFGTYDTIDDDQFIRRGSRQLDTWQFDTLAMYLGVDRRGHYAPHWVPYPTHEPHGSPQYRPPEWYVDQLTTLHNAGAPVRYAATFFRSKTIRRSFAVLTGFSEVYKHGEGDAIYFSGVTFSEWRDPGDASTKHHHAKLPAHVKFDQYGIPVDVGHPHASIKPRSAASGKGLGYTLGDLAHSYYGDATKWRLIARANHLKGGAGDDPILKHWFPQKYVKPGKTVAPRRWVLKLVVPKEQAPRNRPSTPPARGRTKAAAR